LWSTDVTVGVDLQHPHLTVETTCATKSDYGIVRSRFGGPVVSSVGRWS
jgi:hypothetical protein